MSRAVFKRRNAIGVAMSVALAVISLLGVQHASVISLSGVRDAAAGTTGGFNVTNSSGCVTAYGNVHWGEESPTDPTTMVGGQLEGKCGNNINWVLVEGFDDSGKVVGTGGFFDPNTTNQHFNIPVGVGVDEVSICAVGNNTTSERCEDV